MSLAPEQEARVREIVGEVLEARRPKLAIVGERGPTLAIPPSEGDLPSLRRLP